MGKFKFTNAKIVTPSGINAGEVLVSGGSIAEVGASVNSAGAEVIDAGGRYLSPGFIDIHVHGGGGFSAMSDLPEDIVGMCDAHAEYGTTSILPTTMSAPLDMIRAAVRAIKAASALPSKSNILGVHLEGPCLSQAQSGAQSPDDLLDPSKADLGPLLSEWPEGTKIMGVAPELPGALELGDELTSRGILPSIAHSDATYAQVEEAITHGYTDVTHLYSGCSGLIRINSYRIPGVIEAGLNLDALTTQVIADGKHLPIELLQLIYRCKGPDKIILITDGLEYSAAELEEGTTYTQKSGMDVIYEDGVMKLPSRQAFAGSVATMNRLIRNMLAAGVPLFEAVRMASTNPARRIGATTKGSIAPGMDADIVLFDDNIDVTLVMNGGNIVVKA